MRRCHLLIAGCLLGSLAEASAAAADTTVSAEFPLDITLAAQGTPVGVAFGATQYGIVWQYTRPIGDAATPTTCFGFSTVDLTGARLQSTGIEIACPVNSSTLHPTQFGDIVFDGTNYLVTWRQVLADSSSTFSANVGTRIDTSAHVLDPIPGASLGGFDSSPPGTLASGAGASLLSYLGSPSGSTTDSFNGSFIASGAAPAAGPRFAIGRAGGSSIPSSANCAWDGLDFACAWRSAPSGESNPTDINAGRISTAGTQLDGAAGVTVISSGTIGGNPSVGSSSNDFPRIASDGSSGSLVVWFRDLLLGTTPPSGIYAARFGRNGTVADPGGFLVTTLPGAQTLGTSLRAIWDGAAYLVLYGANGYHVGTDAQLVDSFSIDMHGSTASPLAAGNGSGAIIIYASGTSAVGRFIGQGHRSDAGPGDASTGGASTGGATTTSNGTTGATGSTTGAVTTGGAFDASTGSATSSTGGGTTGGASTGGATSSSGGGTTGGSLDAGAAIDSGAVDSAIDATSVDAVAIDSTPPVEAGSTNGGLLDAGGAEDGGTQGSQDAMAALDASHTGDASGSETGGGTDGSGPPPDDGGCATRPGAEKHPSIALMAWVAIGLFAARRRTKRAV